IPCWRLSLFRRRVIVSSPAGSSPEVGSSRIKIASLFKLYPESQSGTPNLLQGAWEGAKKALQSQDMRSLPRSKNICKNKFSGIKTALVLPMATFGRLRQVSDGSVPAAYSRSELTQGHQRPDLADLENNSSHNAPLAAFGPACLLINFFI